MSNTASNERMPTIADDQLSEAQRKVIAEVMAGPRGKVIGPWNAIMRSPGFMEQAHKFGEFVRYKSSLDKWIIEMAATMVARSWTQQVVWASHYPLSIKAGLKASIGDAIAAGRRPPEMTPREQSVYDFLSELFNNKSVSDVTYADAVAQFGEQVIIDLIGVVTYFTMLAMVMNVSRTPAIYHPAPATSLQPLPLQP